jgi:serine/threonine protein phosphatase PrpC
VITFLVSDGRNHPWLAPAEIAQVLVDRAVELGSLDNVTVIVVDVRPRVGQ